MDAKTTPVGRPRLPELPEDAFSPGALIGDYVVERLVAHGGHGSVYAACHRVLGRRAAVKVLRREFAGSGEMEGRFIREARVVNRIRHPDIIDIYDLGTLADGRPYCVMEFLDGRGLDVVIRERAPLPAAEAVAILAPLCGALQAAHAAGVVHRDVKASNVMVLAGAGQIRVKLLDFGIAKSCEPADAGLTTVGQRLGTMGAMSPEQIVGSAVDARADVYALGVLLFQMLTGRLPFSGPDANEVERMHLEVAPPRPSEVAPVPPTLDAVVGRCLEKYPDRRWPSAEALLHAAQAALETSSSIPVRRQLAVTVQVFLGLPDAPDEEALIAQADAADVCQAALDQAGFQVPISTPGVLLGVKLLPADASEDRRARSDAVELARALKQTLALPGLTLWLMVGVAEAEVRQGPGGPQLVGGAACLPPSLPQGGTPGLSIGPELLAPQLG